MECKLIHAKHESLDISFSRGLDNHGMITNIDQKKCKSTCNRFCRDQESSEHDLPDRIHASRDQGLEYTQKSICVEQKPHNLVQFETGTSERDSVLYSGFYCLIFGERRIQ